MAKTSRTHLYFAVLISTCAWATPTLAYTSLNPSTLAAREANGTAASPTEKLDCSTDFSGDYYGFGVRLGVYFAWLSSYCANTLLPSEASGALDTNSIFLLALLVSLFKGSRMHEIYQFDGLILMHLCSGFLFSSFSIWGYRTKHYCHEGPRGIRHYGRFGTHFRLALTTAIAIYGNWFWWDGVKDGLRKSTEPGCTQVYTWLFGKWKIDGGVHIIYIMMSLGTSVYYAGMCLAAAVTFIIKLFSLRKGQRLEVRFETGLSPAELKLIFTFNRIWNFFWMIVCVVIIELTLSQNHMMSTLAQNHNIAYPAQLLPLIVGALSFIRVCFLIYAQARNKQDKKHQDIADAAAAANSAADWPDTPSKPAAEAAKRQSLGLHIRSVFSPNLGARSSTLSRQSTQALEDEMQVRLRRPWHHRYAVTWLPWLSLLEFWHSRAGGDVETVTAQSELATTDTSYGGAARDVKKGMGMELHEIKEGEVCATLKESLLG